MSGIHDYNRAAFETASLALLAAGHNPVSPIEIHRAPELLGNRYLLPKGLSTRPFRADDLE